MTTINAHSPRVATAAAHETTSAPAPTYTDADLANFLHVQGLSDEEIQACLLVARPTLEKALPLLADPKTRKEGKRLLTEAFKAAGIPEKRAKEAAHKIADGVKKNSDLVIAAGLIAIALYKKDVGLALKIAGAVLTHRLEEVIRERGGELGDIHGSEFAPPAPDMDKIVGTNVSEEPIVQSADLGFETK